MARIRTIKPEFFTSEQIAECSPNARLLFIGMWPFSDDNGIHPASFKRLKMEVFPSDSFSEDEIKAMVSELINQRLVQQYEVENQRFWIITGWHKHQKIDKPTSRYPLPKEPHSQSTRGTIDERSSTCSRALEHGMESNGMESNGMESNGMESNGMESNGMESNGMEEESPQTAPLHSQRETSRKSARESFVTPTLEEISAYCQERGNRINPAAFLAHYESKGWKVGKTPMTNWRAAIRKWETSENSTTASQNNRQRQSVVPFDQEQDEYRQSTGGLRT